jgi:hypothetical protein
MNCTITFNEQTTLFLNELASTLGQITAGIISTVLVLPMYNFYKTKVKTE